MKFLRLQFVFLALLLATFAQSALAAEWNFVENGVSATGATYTSTVSLADAYSGEEFYLFDESAGTMITLNVTSGTVNLAITTDWAYNVTGSKNDGSYIVYYLDGLASFGATDLWDYWDEKWHELEIDDSGSGSDLYTTTLGVGSYTLLFGISLQLDSQAGDDYGTAGYSPAILAGFNEITATLEVTPTPIPGAIWLLGSGVVGLLGLRRRFGK